MNPETINKRVLNKGKSQTKIGVIPCGGQTLPKTSEGHKEQWKKAQKNPKNNITSDAIKK